MSFLTQPAYVQYLQVWPEEAREHPVIDWMIDYEQEYGFGTTLSSSDDPAPWYASDWVNAKSTQPAEPGAASWAKLVADYGIFTPRYHEPTYYATHENATEYEMIRSANVYGSSPAPSIGAEEGKDAKGREWDVNAPGVFHFVYEKHPEGHIRG